MENITHTHESTQNHIHSQLQGIFEETTPVVKYNKGETIYYQGDTATCFYYLKKGKVRVYITSADGLEKTLSTATHGDILGEAAFFEKKPRVSCASALTNVEVVVINSQKLLDLIQQKPQIALELLGIQASRIRMLSTQIDSITFFNAEERIAQVLLESAQEEKGKTMVYLTHEEMGSIVGTSRVTVSKILTKFCRKNYIKTAYRSVEILDKNALAKIIKK